jgi:hypothetical protein
MAVVTLVGTGLSAGALVTSSVALGVIGAVALAGLLLAEIMRRPKRPVFIVGFAVAVLLAGSVLLRYFVNPGVTTFVYDDSPMSPPSHSPFANMEFIPVTVNPSTGVTLTTLPAGDGRVTVLPVSCMQEGQFNHAPALWVKIVGGSYESLWIPWTYLTGIELGPALTLLYCSDWRWRLQNG